MAEPSDAHRPPDIDPPRYDQYMSRDETRAVLDAHLALLTEWEAHPDADVRAHVAQQRAAAEVAFQRLDGFYRIGALPRHPDLPDNALDEIKARNLGLPYPKPSLWSRLTGRG